ncbi:MAG: MBL fold metallo-hydrolase [Bacteroidia bacterium]
MITVKKFTFNPFQENTYVLHDESKEAVIIDPGCSDESERQELEKYIREVGLKPVHLLNSHCHIDHIFGNRFVQEEFSLKLEAHRLEVPILEGAIEAAMRFGISPPDAPPIEIFLEENGSVSFGKSELNILFLPGHAPGHIAFHSPDDNFIISGDVLFHGSIGRTDLPGGNLETLMDSICNKMMKLENSCTVYSGHGPDTTIETEKKHNPFLLNYCK